MSAPVYELLKRPDELFVVEHAHLRPRFVEDSVRIALKDVLESLPTLHDGDFLLSRQVNLETIHDHDVVAERHGTVAELRARSTRESRVAQTTRNWLATPPDEDGAGRRRLGHRHDADRTGLQAPLHARSRHPFAGTAVSRTGSNESKRAVQRLDRRDATAGS